VKQAVAQTYEQARRMNAPRAIALCQCFNGALEFQAGNWREAEAALRDSIKLHREIGAASGEALACQRLGALLTARGQLDEAMAVLEEGVIAAEHALLRAHCLARLYATMVRNRLDAGDVATAAHALAQGLAMHERHGHCHTCDALLFPVAVSLRIRQGELAAAEDFCNQFEQAAQKYASRMWIAMALASRAELTAAQGDWDGAIAGYDQAHENFAAAGNLYESACCLAAAGAARLRRGAVGDVEAAQRAMEEAQAIGERIGFPMAN